jgi:RNA polymerase sigma-70 factor (ECF subfamily)
MNTEASLVRNLKDPKTREKAFLTLIDQYQERIYWYIRKLVITHENADDVLQNTFFRIFRNIGSFQGRSSLATWMFRIAHNESLRVLEKQNKARMTSLDEISPSYLKDLSQDAYFDGEKTKLRLHQIIETNLSNKQRIVFNMKYFDDLSFKQMAEILHVNENTLKSAYYSAVKVIEKEIEREAITF